jgi:hypothetical protein
MAAASSGFCWCHSPSDRLIAIAAAIELPHLHMAPQAALSPRAAEPSLCSTAPVCTLALLLPLRRLDAGTSHSVTTRAQRSLLASANAAAMRAPSRRRLAPLCVRSPACVHHLEHACCHVATSAQRFSLQLDSDKPIQTTQRSYVSSPTVATMRGTRLGCGAPCVDALRQLHSVTLGRPALPHSSATI